MSVNNVLIENPKLLLPDIKMSAGDLTELTGFILGTPQARASDKAAATKRFAKALEKVIEDKERAKMIGYAIVKMDDVKVAKKELEVRVQNAPKKEKKVKTDKAEPLIGEYVGRKIYPKVKENPRRKPTGVGFRAMELVLSKPGVTYDEYINAGFRNIDLRYDLERGHIELR
ncbi:MAG: hypothetical protein EB165_02690 [Euryarchaeota archaeon]|nr:hypothetical protein [Euryarchaeota archaeon]NDB93537.1 hypothetical protein [Euryarchaeota archaeon]